MGTDILVDEIEAGRQILDLLKGTELAAEAAMLVSSDEWGESRLFIVTNKLLELDIQAAYRKIGRLIEIDDLVDVLPLRRIVVTLRSDRFITLMLRAVRGRNRKKEVRIRNETCNGIIVQDAYIYHW